VAVNWNIPRESLEFVGPIQVYADGVALTFFEVAVVGIRDRPVETSWSTPDVGHSPSVHGVLVGPGSTRVLPPGDYRIWVRIADAPERPVISHVGGISIT
jgi:hypothetical protein